MLTVLLTYLSLEHKDLLPILLHLELDKEVLKQEVIELTKQTDLDYNTKQRIIVCLNKNT